VAEGDVALYPFFFSSCGMLVEEQEGSGLQLDGGYGKQRRLA
jgi:hypothetical protein